MIFWFSHYSWLAFISSCGIFRTVLHSFYPMRNWNILSNRVWSLYVYSPPPLSLQDWADLIEYVLRKCTRVRIEHPDKKENKNPHKPVVEAPGIDLSWVLPRGTSLTVFHVFYFWSLCFHPSNVWLWLFYCLSKSSRLYLAFQICCV